MNVMLLGRQGIKFGVDDGSDDPAYIASQRSMAAARAAANPEKQYAEAVIAKINRGEGITEYESSRLGFKKPQELFAMLQATGRVPGGSNVEVSSDKGPGAAALLLPIGLAVAAYFTLK